MRAQAKRRERERTIYIDGERDLTAERAFEKTASTPRTSGTRLSTVDNGEVKKAALRTQEAFLEFDHCLQRCKKKGHMSKSR